MVFKDLFQRCPCNTDHETFSSFFNVLNQARSHCGFMEVMILELRWRPISKWRGSVTEQVLLKTPLKLKSDSACVLFNSASDSPKSGPCYNRSKAQFHPHSPSTQPSSSPGPPAGIQSAGRALWMLQGRLPSCSSGPGVTFLP